MTCMEFSTSGQLRRETARQFRVLEDAFRTVRVDFPGLDERLWNVDYILPVRAGRLLLKCHEDFLFRQRFKKPRWDLRLENMPLLMPQKKRVLWDTFMHADSWFAAIRWWLAPTSPSWFRDDWVDHFHHVEILARVPALSLVPKEQPVTLPRVWPVGVGSESEREASRLTVAADIQASACGVMRDFFESLDERMNEVPEPDHYRLVFKQEIRKRLDISKSEFRNRDQNGEIPVHPGDRCTTKKQIRVRVDWLDDHGL